MNRSELIAQIKTKKSFLCVGLDTDINRIPKHLLDAEDPIFEFNMLNSKIGSSASKRCFGMRFMSVSKPTHKKDFFVFICAINSDLFIAFF